MNQIQSTADAGMFRAQQAIDAQRFQIPVAADQDRLREVAQEFEALFMKQLLDSMRETLNPEHRLVEPGIAGEIYDDMLYDEYSKIMARTGGLGLADLIVDQYRAS